MCRLLERVCFVSFVSTACVLFSSPHGRQGNQNRVTLFIVSLAPYPAAPCVQYYFISIILFHPSTASTPVTVTRRFYDFSISY